MRHLTSTELSTLAERLRLRRGETLEQIRERLHASGASDTLALVNHLDSAGDWAGADQLSETDIALLGHELATLSDIDGALKRLAAGTAAVCSICEGPIPAERLLVNPTAHTCVPCQQALEKHRHAPASGM